MENNDFHCEPGWGKKGKQKGKEKGKRQRKGKKKRKEQGKTGRGWWGTGFMAKNALNLLNCLGAAEPRLAAHCVAGYEDHPDGPGARDLYGLYDPGARASEVGEAQSVGAIGSRDFSAERKSGGNVFILAGTLSCLSPSVAGRCVARARSVAARVTTSRDQSIPS